MTAVTAVTVVCVSFPLRARKKKVARIDVTHVTGVTARIEKKIGHEEITRQKKNFGRSHAVSK